jgi:hypothetical protein
MQRTQADVLHNPPCVYGLVPHQEAQLQRAGMLHKVCHYLADLHASLQT